MNSDRNYFVVGIFTVTMAVGILAALFVLSGRGEKGDRYYVDFRDVSGIRYGTRVSYMGFPVGQVTSVSPTLEGGRLAFTVEMEIASSFSNWNVPVDSIARASSDSILSPPRIDIRAGESSEHLTPGARLIGEDDLAFDAAAARALAALEKLSECDCRAQGSSAVGSAE